MTIPAGAPALGGTSYKTTYGYDAGGNLLLESDPSAGTTGSRGIYVAPGACDRGVGVAHLHGQRGAVGGAGHDGRLRIEPHLPAEWSELSFGFDYCGESISVAR